MDRPDAPPTGTTRSPGTPERPEAPHPTARPTAHPTVRFAERLTPSPFAVVVLAGLGVTLGLVLWVVSPTLALVVAVLAAILVVAGVVATSPRVAVVDGELLAGRAHIPASLLAAPTALDDAGLRAALGPGSDARTYAVLRTWVHSAVRVEVTDPADPVPAWIVSTRHPDALVAALVAAGTPTVSPAEGPAAEQGAGLADGSGPAEAEG